MLIFIIVLVLVVVVVVISSYISIIGKKKIIHAN
jgi:hypothetical protein